jgi:hypothetical protein
MNTFNKMNAFINESIDYTYLDAYRFTVQITVRVSIDEISSQSTIIVESDMLYKTETFALINTLRKYCFDICELKRQELKK